MSDLDDFARNTVAPALRHGEVMLSIGWMANGANWRNHSERYFAVGTNQRLVVIKTSAGLMFGTPKIGNEGIVEYELAYAANAVSRTIAPLTFNLAFDSPQGRVGYAVPSPTIVGATGVEGHTDFVKVYLPWLCRHVAAGSLRTAEGAAAAAAEWQQRGIVTAANERYLVSIGDTNVSATRWVKWPFLVGLMLGAALVGLGFKTKHDAEDQRRYAWRHIDFIHANEDSPDIQYDPAVEIARDHAKIADADAAEGRASLMAIAGAIVIVAGIVGSIVLTTKKRKRARAAVATGAALPT